MVRVAQAGDSARPHGGGFLGVPGGGGGQRGDAGVGAVQRADYCSRADAGLCLYFGVRDAGTAGRGGAAVRAAGRQAGVVCAADGGGAGGGEDGVCGLLPAYLCREPLAMDVGPGTDAGHLCLRRMGAERQPGGGGVHAGPERAAEPVFRTAGERGAGHCDAGADGGQPAVCRIPDGGQSADYEELRAG